MAYGSLILTSPVDVLYKVFAISRIARVLVALVVALRDIVNWVPESTLDTIVFAEIPVPLTLMPTTMPAVSAVVTTADDAVVVHDKLNVLDASSAKVGMDSTRKSFTIKKPEPVIVALIAEAVAHCCAVSVIPLLFVSARSALNVVARLLAHTVADFELALTVLTGPRAIAPLRSNCIERASNPSVRKSNPHKLVLESEG